MTLGIHGIPLDMPDENYDILKNGALYNYQFVNLDNRDQYYYKRVFMAVSGPSTIFSPVPNSTASV